MLSWHNLLSWNEMCFSFCTGVHKPWPNKLMDASPASQTQFRLPFCMERSDKGTQSTVSKTLAWLMPIRRSTWPGWFLTPWWGWWLVSGEQVRPQRSPDQGGALNPQQLSTDTRRLSLRMPKSFLLVVGSLPCLALPWALLPGGLC